MNVQVNRGDTLHKLLRERGVPENKLQQASEQIAALNNLPSPDLIRAGTQLVFPDHMSFGSETIALTRQPTAYEHLSAQGTATSGQSMGAMGRFAFQTTARDAKRELGNHVHDLRSHAEPEELALAIADSSTFLGSDAAKLVSPEERAQLSTAIGVARNKLEDITGLGATSLVDGTAHRMGDKPRFTLATTDSSGSDAGVTSEGQPSTIEWNRVTLKATNAETGAIKELDSNAKLVDDIRKDFKEYGNETFTSWDVGSSFMPAGNLGNLVSAQRTDSGFTGGAHPFAETTYATYNAATGEKVKLSELLSPKELDAVMTKAEKSLRSSEDEIGAVEFRDSARIREIADDSFAVFMDGGRPKIAIGMPSGHGAARGMMMEAVVDAPANHEFLTKLGLNHVEVATNALYDIVSSGEQANPAVPYHAIDLGQVQSWFKTFYGGDASKLSPAEREAAATALEDAGAGVTLGQRMEMHQLAEEIRAGGAVAGPAVNFNDDLETFYKARDHLWGNSHFLDSNTDFGPATRYDFEPNGKVSGWKMSMSDDGEISRKRFEGGYTIGNDGTVTVKTRENGAEKLQLSLGSDGAIGLAKDGKALATRPDFGATPAEEPSVALLERPFFAPAQGAYGHPAKLTFDPDGSFRGFHLAYNPLQDIHPEDVSGKWAFDNGKITLTFDKPVDGKTTLEGVLTDQGPKFNDDGAFKNLTGTPEFWDA